MRVDTIASVTPLLSTADSSLQTLGGFTDFSKVGFTITTTAGKSITVKADRCGGSCSFAVVTVGGEEKFRSVTPDDELKAKVDAEQAADPAMMPYFFLQARRRVVRRAQRNRTSFFLSLSPCASG